ALLGQRQHGRIPVPVPASVAPLTQVARQPVAGTVALAVRQEATDGLDGVIKGFETPGILAHERQHGLHAAVIPARRDVDQHQRGQIHLGFFRVGKQCREAAHRGADDRWPVGQGCAHPAEVFDELLEIVLATGCAIALTVTARVIADRLPAGSGQLASGTFPSVLCLAEAVRHEHTGRTVVAIIAQAQPDAVIGPYLAAANVVVEFTHSFHTAEYGFTLFISQCNVILVRSGRHTRACGHFRTLEGVPSRIIMVKSSTDRSTGDKLPLTPADWEQAALALIAEKGMAALRVEPLARRLGITKGSFYWHFPGRDELLVRAVERWERQDRQHLKLSLS